MRITPTSNLYFQSRKTDLKEADVISRKSKSAFPVISTTKYRTFAQRNAFDEWERRHGTLAKMNFAIKRQREELDADYDLMRHLGENRAVSEVIPVLRTIRKTKRGNCSEMAAAAFGLLCANGYLNSRRASLYDKVVIIDKRTGKIVLNSIEEVDHCAVMTSMQKEDKFNEKTCDIVIDPWADVVASKQDAYLKYETIFKDKIQEIEEDCLKDVELYYTHSRENKEPFDPNNYKIYSKLLFQTRDDYEDKDVKHLGDQVKWHFASYL